ncbi:prephenate dehydrogenase/arogenate dehydrogenase family protein [Modestobacter sp. I12A-02628]|uniref:Prephenate dehydrogenase/arogenate dehydrogenase family protein n=1 Tax=Goekera deserti TaxID=2497753 RepID=A0A7K3WF01_9ACTN|nr:prephenate dehydrogenase/arogenate dehydrogenase family protein [Goekera deserti]MPQ97997.1 prephenate dehydrogenase/arogenate dehydrogenase family protein [Goekera deserti]NDI48644.1 prephenate dehydrogenase/arogenate dehydrogenase family protein [Goekera deserti]NEL54977.1 prephenate dehydrogenase/arogenate dehydrogenase family protein [Goekera deserti]
MSRLPVPTLPAPPVSVLGLGQLGGSLAAALAAAGRPVSGWDVDPAARDAAAAAGVRVSDRLEGVVVLAVPLPVLATALDGLELAEDATVTDLGSVKVPVQQALGARLGDRFVGGHPMCGTERSGHAAADPALFRGARWAVCLEPGTSPARWLRVAEVALAVGAEVVPVTAAEHDDAVAAISAVPHLLAAALAAAAADAGPLALSLGAGSFRDGTRVVGSDPAFVTALLEQNAGPVATALAAVQRQLARPWPELVADGHAARAAWAGPAGRRPVRVPLDRTALLAVGRAGGAVTGRLAAFVEGWVPDR